MTKPKSVDLDAVREQIDALDEQLHRLLNERARLAQQVGISKTAAGSTVDFYRPEREAQVLRQVKERNQGPLRTEDLLRLFREIMSACLAQQEPLKVAFLGPEGTFTQTAVLTHFGHAVRALPLPSVDEVFHEVESGAVDFGVVAIENSTEGMVINTLDRFLNSSARICGEIELRIHHFLMGRMQSLEGIKRIHLNAGAASDVAAQSRRMAHAFCRPLSLVITDLRGARFIHRVEALLTREAGPARPRTGGTL